ncbi:MAG: MFS transporter, partial [Cyanobacteria bacterium J06555_12]
MLTELFQLRGRYKVLHLTWFAFFLSFVVWFNYAPLATTIQEELGLTDGQRGVIGLCNIALTVPARIIIG